MDPDGASRGACSEPQPPRGAGVGFRVLDGLLFERGVVGGVKQGNLYESATSRSDLLHLPRLDDHVAKKPNYEFEKRKKEQERQAKKTAKLQQREDAARQRAEDIANGVVPAEEY